MSLENAQNFWNKIFVDNHSNPQMLLHWKRSWPKSHVPIHNFCIFPDQQKKIQMKCKFLASNYHRTSVELIKGGAVIPWTQRPPWIYFSPTNIRLGGSVIMNLEDFIFETSSVICHYQVSCLRHASWCRMLHSVYSQQKEPTRLPKYIHRRVNHLPDKIPVKTIKRGRKKSEDTLRMPRSQHNNPEICLIMGIIYERSLRPFALRESTRDEEDRIVFDIF